MIVALDESGFHSLMGSMTISYWDDHDLHTSRSAHCKIASVRFWQCVYEQSWKTRDWNNLSPTGMLHSRLQFEMHFRVCQLLQCIEIHYSHPSCHKHTSETLCFKQRPHTKCSGGSFNLFPSPSFVVTQLFVAPKSIWRIELGAAGCLVCYPQKRSTCFFFFFFSCLFFELLSKLFKTFVFAHLHQLTFFIKRWCSHKNRNRKSLQKC